MKKVKVVLISIAVLLGLAAVYFEICNESTLVMHPKGVIAHEELSLIRTNIGWMLVVIIPTLIWLFVTAWKYQSKHTDEEYEPEGRAGVFTQALLWLIPSSVVAVMSVITWNAAHRLDPYAEISSSKPLIIQVVAMDWKWLFIYPEHNIASLNFFQFPEQTPVQFKLTGDDAPMNSFWIPQMSGQIYAMTGMVNTLNIMADGPGEYRGRAVEINGDGYADMTFKAKSCSKSEFDAWIKKVQSSNTQLSQETYSALSKHEINDAVVLYSTVEKELFDKIVMKNMAP